MYVLPSRIFVFGALGVQLLQNSSVLRVQLKSFGNTGYSERIRKIYRMFVHLEDLDVISWYSYLYVYIQCLSKM